MDSLRIESALPNLPDFALASFLGWSAAVHIDDTLRLSGFKLPILHTFGTEDSEYSHPILCLAGVPEIDTCERMTNMASCTFANLTKKLLDEKPVALWGLLDGGYAAVGERVNRLKCAWDRMHLSFRTWPADVTRQLLSPMVLHTEPSVSDTSRSLAARCWSVDTSDLVNGCVDVSAITYLSNALASTASRLPKEQVRNAFFDRYGRLRAIGWSESDAMKVAGLQTGLWLLGRVYQGASYDVSDRIKQLSDVLAANLN